MRASVKVNKSLEDKMLLLQQTAEERVQDQLKSVADYAISVSPVDTGAYVESFSFAVGAGRPRGKSSVNRPKTSRAEATTTARANLYSDLEKFDLGSSKTITLRNNAPHARSVEDGGPNWRKQGYSVFTLVRNKFSG